MSSEAHQDAIGEGATLNCTEASEAITNPRQRGETSPREILGRRPCCVSVPLRAGVAIDGAALSKRPAGLRLNDRYICAVGGHSSQQLHDARVGHQAESTVGGFVQGSGGLGDGGGDALKIALSLDAGDGCLFAIGCDGLGKAEAWRAVVRVDAIEGRYSVAGHKER
jgi:hypothetical protein